MPSCSGLGGEKHEKVSSIYVVIAMTLEGTELSTRPSLWRHAVHALYKVCLQSGGRGDVWSFAQRGGIPFCISSNMKPYGHLPTKKREHYHQDHVSISIPNSAKT